MRTLPVIAVLAFCAALAALSGPSPAALDPIGGGAGHLPLAALFTFAVSAFRERLR